jgi:hypothetical protein
MMDDDERWVTMGDGDSQLRLMMDDGWQWATDDSGRQWMTRVNGSG